MPPTRVAEKALRLGQFSAPRQYTCISCRIQAARRFHTTRLALAEEPFYKRLQKTLFGSKEAREDERIREEKHEERLENIAQQEDPTVEPELKIGKDGREYQIAALIDPSTHKNYVEATHASGLDIIGGREWVKQKSDRGEQYVGFLPQKRVAMDRRGWQSVLHHIAVEIVLLQKVHRPAIQVCYPRQGDAKAWRHTRHATISSHGPGKKLVVSFTDPKSKSQILQAIPTQQQEGQGQDERVLSSELQGILAAGLPEAESPKAGKNYIPPWMVISVADATVKMALVKRILQLTGKRIPDPAVSNASTLADIYKGLWSTVQPKKLAKTRELRSLQSASNVTVRSRRQTSIHKEKAIGRWKIIEEELTRRDLPVTGSRWPSGSKLTYLS